jgi:hypothetical protein
MSTHRTTYSRPHVHSMHSNAPYMHILPVPSVGLVLGDVVIYSVYSRVG